MTDDITPTAEKIGGQAEGQPEAQIEDQVDDRPAPPTTWPELSDPGMLDRIKQIIVDEGKVPAEDITPDATLESLGLVSIDVVSILMGVEEEFDAYVPMTSELSTARNLSELIDVIVTQMTPDELKNVTSKS